jgi:hypothetical protein
MTRFPFVGCMPLLQGLTASLVAECVLLKGIWRAIAIALHVFQGVG